MTGTRSSACTQAGERMLKELQDRYETALQGLARVSGDDLRTVSEAAAKLSQAWSKCRHVEGDEK